MTNTAFAPFADGQLLSVQDVARALSVSRLTVYRLIERRALPAYRVARRIRFAARDIGRYLASVKTPDIYGSPKT